MGLIASDELWFALIDTQSFHLSVSHRADWAHTARDTAAGGECCCRMQMYSFTLSQHRNSENVYVPVWLVRPMEAEVGLTVAFPKQQWRGIFVLKIRPHAFPEHRERESASQQQGPLAAKLTINNVLFGVVQIGINVLKTWCPKKIPKQKAEETSDYSLSFHRPV